MQTRVSLQFSHCVYNSSPHTHATLEHHPNSHTRCGSASSRSRPPARSGCSGARRRGERSGCSGAPRPLLQSGCSGAPRRLLPSGCARGAGISVRAARSAIRLGDLGRPETPEMAPLGQAVVGAERGADHVADRSALTPCLPSANVPGDEHSDPPPRSLRT